MLRAIPHTQGVALQLGPLRPCLLNEVLLRPKRIRQPRLNGHHAQSRDHYQRKVLPVTLLEVILSRIVAYGTAVWQDAYRGSASSVCLRPKEGIANHRAHDCHRQAPCQQRMKELSGIDVGRR